MRMDFDKFMENVLRMTSRREFLCKNAPKCIMCGADQIQLVDSFLKPARWKCRICKFAFQHEPNSVT